jgi:hypothetical protein
LVMKKKGIGRTTVILAIVIIIVVAAVGIYYLTLPQPGGVPQITGTVTDEDGLPVEGVKVTVDGYEAFTDSSGFYSINVTDLETYTVDVEKDGYVPETKTVDVTEKKKYTVNFVMKLTKVAVYLDPSEIVLNTSEVSVGDRFNVTAWVSDVEDLFAYQVALYYNASVINVNNAWQPTWNSSYVFYGKTGEPLNASEYFDSWGQFLIGYSLLAGAESFTGDGLLAVFEFEIVGSPATDLTSDLIISYIPSGGTFETKLKDPSEAVIYFTATDGHYEYTS